MLPEFRMKQTDSASSTNPFALHLQEIMKSCSLPLQAEDHKKLEDSVSALVEFINSMHDVIVSDPEENEDPKQIAMEILTELLRFISSPLLDQMVVDALSFELPKLVVKFAGISVEFCELAECVIDHLISTCSPRDMLAVICEALDAPGEMFKEPAYFTPLLSGLSKVFVSLQRRHFENIKEALPAVLNVLQAVSSELDDENGDSFTVLIGKATRIATSIHEVSQKLQEGRQKEQMLALLGLFVLQTMALTSSSPIDANSNIPMMSQLSKFLPLCNLSYLGLVTGCDVEALIVILGDNDDHMNCFSLVKQGASVAVIWGIISDEVAKAANEDLAVVKDNLRKSQDKRWQTIGLLKYFLSSIHQPWGLKEYAIDFFISILDGNISQRSSKEHVNCSLDIPSLYSALQALEMVIIHAPDAVLRRKAFVAMKMVLADIPCHQRFNILKALITNDDSPSMIAILIDLVRKEMFTEISREDLPGNDKVVAKGDKVCPSSPFWSKDVLELVEFVLKPPKGGPPSLPEQYDAVLSALNLFRFILITESTGETNYTGIMLENVLRKANTEWFLPLRMLVSRIITEDDGEEACVALNPLQLVLQRCIELTEDKLQHTT